MLTKASDYVARAKQAVEGDESLNAAQKEQYLRNLEQVEVQVLYMMYRNYDAVFYTTAEARYEFMLKFFDMAQKLNVNALMENGKSLGELRADALDN